MDLIENEKRILNEIKEKYYEIDLLLDKFSEETRESILDAHNTNYNLLHCSRWGLTAIREILD